MTRVRGPTSLSAIIPVLWLYRVPAPVILFLTSEPRRGVKCGETACDRRFSLSSPGYPTNVFAHAPSWLKTVGDLLDMCTQLIPDSSMAVASRPHPNQQPMPQRYIL